MSSENNYNLIDKALHYLAFSFPIVQRILNELENDLYKNDLINVKSQSEVFVTGLPRSGTTLLLELLYKTNEFSTFSYRHMPFVMSPLLWSKVSNLFSKKSKLVERAHGDGMQVSFDSPEAFEEVIFIAYLKEKFIKDDRLVALTPAIATKKFANNFKLIIKKLLMSSSLEGHTKRYLSKNNANCSRLSLLSRLFPTATIIVPFREPLSHIGSLMTQHLKFKEMHSTDKFSSNYMRWLGHFDFGENFKPIDFDQWLNSFDGKPDYTDENFWIEYWCAAYENILNNKTDNIHLVDFDRLLSHPAESLSAISDSVGLLNKHDFIAYAADIRSPTSVPGVKSAIKVENLSRASRLYKALQTASK